VRRRLAVVLLAPFLLTSCDNATGPAPETVKVGVMLPLTGGSPIDAGAQQQIVALAVEDINAYFVDQDIPVQVVPEILDSGNDPVGITAALARFTEEGVDAVAASGTSSNLDYAGPALESFPGIVLHATSTAVTLSRADNLYRLIPTDAFTSGAIAQRIWAAGKRRLVVLFRNDIWGTGLSESLDSSFQALGGELLTATAYNARLVPESMDAPVSSVEALLAGAGGTDDVAVAVLAFNEITDLLKGLDPGSPLLEVPWYGSDGFVMNDFIVADSQAAVVGEMVGLISPAVAVTDNPAIAAITDRLVPTLGYEPRGNNYLIYDAFMAAALVAADAGTDGVAQKLERALAADVYVTGPIQLDANGDRTQCAFEFWRITGSDGNYRWAVAD